MRFIGQTVTGFAGIMLICVGAQDYISLWLGSIMIGAGGFVLVQVGRSLERHQ